jgi:hypothetical protein|tara:strand:- start:3825 stop:4727 length:903 start_codon:yes stop_codon:yes gene_type:complete
MMVKKKDTIYDGPVVVYIGTSANGEDAEAQMVLEYTIRKNTTMPVEIHWMKQSHDPNDFWYADVKEQKGWQTQQWPTPFSGYRWGIPAACGFKGQSIYMDHDMLVLQDLAELWNEPWEDGKVAMNKGGWRFCVCKWHNERAEEHLLPIERLRSVEDSHQRTFNFFAQNIHLLQTFDRQWNNFDGENDKLEDIKILHYTDMRTQMHGKYVLERLQKSLGITKEEAIAAHWFDGEFLAHRRDDVVELFDKLYQESLDDGYKVDDYVPGNKGKLHNIEPYGEYTKLSQKGYTSANQFDVSRGE